MDTPVQPTELLRASNLHVTAPRIAVLRVLAERPDLAADAGIDAQRTDLAAEPSDPFGFAVDEAEIVSRPTCPDGPPITRPPIKEHPP